MYSREEYVNEENHDEDDEGDENAHYLVEDLHDALVQTFIQRVSHFCRFLS